MNDEPGASQHGVARFAEDSLLGVQEAAGVQGPGAVGAGEAGGVVEAGAGQHLPMVHIN